MQTGRQRSGFQIGMHLEKCSGVVMMSQRGHPVAIAGAPWKIAGNAWLQVGPYFEFQKLPKWTGLAEFDCSRVKETRW